VAFELVLPRKAFLAVLVSPTLTAAAPARESRLAPFPIATGRAFSPSLRAALADTLSFAFTRQAESHAASTV
jgi:hypothetical protein